MPYAPSRPCTYPGCPRVVVTRGRCELHQKPTVRPPDGRSSAAQGYGYRWQQIRDAYLQQYPVCEGCGAEATEAHHIVAVKYGGTHEYNNLAALCKRCHSRITASDRDK